MKYPEQIGQCREEIHCLRSNKLMKYSQFKITFLKASICGGIPGDNLRYSETLNPSSCQQASYCLYNCQKNLSQI